ncbi:hypothetical protein PM082_016386 [Marasmius tenuissimus]|nr:hypothetical protein PM082_016386 [Marasmius tenuissimus]
MVKGDGLSIGMGVVNAPEGLQTLSPEAPHTFMHSFLDVMTLGLRIVWMCSPGQLVEMVYSFPKLAVLVLDQIRFHPMDTAQAKGLHGMGMESRPQTLELLNPQSRFFIDTLHAFTPCTGLRCFKVSGIVLNGTSLDAIAALCSPSSQLKELSMIHMSNEVDLCTLNMPKLQWTSGADISVLNKLVPVMFPKLKAP